MPTPDQNYEKIIRDVRKRAGLDQDLAHTEIRRGDELVILPETPLEIVRVVNCHEELLAILHVFIDSIDGDIMATQFFDSTFVNKAKKALAKAESK